MPKQIVKSSYSAKISRKGVALFIVLGTIIIVLTFATVILSIIASQARLTHHQVSRIQAYYAGMAGVNYATEMLRLGPTKGGWDPAVARSNEPLSDPDFPISILQPITITITPTGGNNCRIDVTTTYTYTPTSP